MTAIRIDYDNARMYAKKLSQAGDDCADVISNLQKVRGSIGDYWEGVSALVYAEAVQKQIREVKQLKTEIEALALYIKQTANKFEQTEQRLKKMMQSNA